MDSVGTVVLLEKLASQLVAADGIDSRIVDLRRREALKLAVRVLGSSFHTKGPHVESYGQLLHETAHALQRQGRPESAFELTELGKQLQDLMPNENGRRDLLQALTRIASDTAADSTRGAHETSINPGSSILGRHRSPLFGPELGRMGPLALAHSSLGSSLLSQNPRGPQHRSSAQGPSSSRNSSFLDMSRSNLAATAPDADANAVPPSLQLRPTHAPPPSGHHGIDTRSAARQAQERALSSTALAETEPRVVRDVILCSQGVDGTLLRLDTRGAFGPSQSYHLVGVNAPGVPRPAEDLAKRMAELGWLYRRVAGFAEAESACGATQAALRAALRTELASHYRMLAVLQEHVAADDEASGGMTLRRLSAWLGPPLERMKLLAVMADLAQEHAGGALLRALHALSQQGSPQGRSLSLEMLRRASAPVAEMLVAFSCRGSLEDPHGEFFVRARPWPRGWPSDGGDGFDLWRDGYEVVAAMLPPFVSTDLAEVVLRAGKTINFLRHCCGDLGWADDEELRQLQEGLERHVASGLVSGDDDSLGAGPLTEMVEAVAERLDGRLKDAMLSTHRLRKHLDSVRGYLLLAHGDYTDHLVNLLREELAAPASEISQMGLGRALAATLQARAGVSETAEGDEELWGRLRLVLEQRAGASGWDCLRVQYHVQAPLTTVLTPGAMAGYAAASGLLLRLKRVESALGSAWRLLKPNAAVLRSHFLRGGFSGDPDPEVQFVRRFAVLVQQATLIRSSMAHLVASVQTYLTFEVVEVEWHDLQARIAEAKDLQGVIAAHDSWLASLGARMLLEGRSAKAMTQLMSLLDSVLAFAGLTTPLSDMLTRLIKLKEAKEHQATASGELRAALDDTVQGLLVGIQEDTSSLPAISRALAKLRQDFSLGVEEFAGSLKTLTWLDLRSLLAKLGA